MVQIKLFLQQNLSALVFFGFIGFVVFSLISSNNQIGPNVKTLVNFSRSTLEEMNVDFDNLLKKSRAVDPKIEGYETVIQQIKDSQKRVSSKSALIPNKISDDLAQNLIRQLVETNRDTNIDYDYVVKRLETEKANPKQPVIATEELRTQNYSKHVQQVQSTVAELVKKYDLK